MIGDLLLFKTPEAYAGAMAAGDVVRHGAVLKEAATGRIVAHIQETGLTQQLLGNANLPSFTPWGMASDALQLASSSYANVQIMQLRGLVEGLRILQYANLGMAAAGIGISVVGFVAMHKRLKDIRSDIEKLSLHLDKRFRNLEDIHWNKVFSHVEVCIERASQVAAMTEPKGEWLRIESELHRESGFLFNSIRGYLEGDQIDIDWFRQLATFLFLADGIRTRCLLEANELKLARSSAMAIGERYRNLFDPISSTNLARRVVKIQDDKTIDVVDRFHQQLDGARWIVSGLREVTDSALSRPLLIDDLIKSVVDGSDYVKALMEEAKEPFVLVEVRS